MVMWCTCDVYIEDIPFNKNTTKKFAKNDLPFQETFICSNLILNIIKSCKICLSLTMKDSEQRHWISMGNRLVGLLFVSAALIKGLSMQWIIYIMFPF